jgi:Bacterial Ig domain
MTENLKRTIIAFFALAILILPSSAQVACDISDEYSDCENGPSVIPDAEYGTPPEEAYSSPVFAVEEESSVSGRFGYPPLATDSNVTVLEDTPLEIPLQAIDPDGDEMTYSIDRGPLAGTVGSISGNRVVYTPDADYTGTDSFSFSAHDGFWDSNTATVNLTVIPNCTHRPPHAFYGLVTIDGEPAPVNTTIMATGPGVSQNLSGNHLIMVSKGSYGSGNNTSQMLVVEGCIENDTPLAFYVNGMQADVCEFTTSGSWQSTYPFAAGEVTNLTLRVITPPPPPDDVYINAMSVTISNPIYGYFQTVRVEKNPWVEIRVTRGVFDIKIAATGYHDFRDYYPILGRNATLAIYENGNPVSPEVSVAFGSRTASYEFLANETRTFDIIMYVPESPEIRDVKHITIFTSSGQESSDPAETGVPVKVLSGRQAFVEAFGVRTALPGT